MKGRQTEKSLPPHDNHSRIIHKATGRRPPPQPFTVYHISINFYHISTPDHVCPYQGIHKSVAAQVKAAPPPFSRTSSRPYVVGVRPMQVTSAINSISSSSAGLFVSGMLPLPCQSASLRLFFLAIFAAAGGTHSSSSSPSSPSPTSECPWEVSAV